MDRFQLNEKVILLFLLKVLAQLLDNCLTEPFFKLNENKMKHLTKPGFFKNAFLLFLLTATSAITWAQDSTSTAISTTSSNMTEETTIWYTQPWVWVVGGAVLILLIIALTRGNSSTSGRTDKVTVTKTTSSETE